MTSSKNHFESERPDRQKRKPPQIGILIENARGYGRSIISGIIRYAQRYGPWNFVHQPMLIFNSKNLRRYQHATGLIVEIKTPELLETLQDMGKPTVIVSGPNEKLPFPRVIADNQAVGRMAMDYLASLGFEHFAFVGHKHEQLSITREETFWESSNAHKIISFYTDSDISNIDALQKQMGDWLTTLPKPAGLFANALADAGEILSLCAERNIRVPEEISVLSVDHDTLLCQLNNPPLSTINHGTRRIGYEAARLLDRLMSGESVSLEPVIIPPVGIETRQSTDTLAVRDPNVAKAIRLIRRQATDGLTVQELMQQIPVSRRTLEMQFQHILGQTMYQEILRVRIERAKKLLIETDMPLVDVSVRCGFSYASQMSALFKKHTGLSPKAFRLKHRF